MSMQDWFIVVLAVSNLILFLILLRRSWPRRVPRVLHDKKVVGRVVDSRMDDDGMTVTMEITDRRMMNLLQGDTLKYLSVSSPDDDLIDFNEFTRLLPAKDVALITGHIPKETFVETPAFTLDKNGRGGTIEMLRVYDEKVGVFNPHYYEAELPAVADQFPDQILFLLEN